MSDKKVEPLTFSTASEWDRWLAKHHATSGSVWLLIAKKDSGAKSVAIGDALDIALTYGWIDGQRKAFDGTHYLQLYAPRGKRSVWSKINREKIAALTAVGRMKPAGIAEVDRAKKDGRWDNAYDPPSRAQVPPDLAKALAARPKAKAAFEALNAQNRFAILFRLHHAKRPETRERNIAKYVAMLLKGEKLYP